MINSIAEVLATVLDALFLVWFVPKMNGTSIKKHPLSLIWAGFVLFLQLMADNVQKNFDLFYIGIVSVVILLFSLSVANKKRLWSIFSAAVFVIVVMLSNSLVFSVCSVFIKNPEVVLRGETQYSRVIYLCVCKIVQFVFYRLLLLIFKKEQIIDLKNALLSLLFTVATAFALGALIKISLLSFSASVDLMILVLALILILLNIILYRMIHQVQLLLKNKYELSLIREKMASEKSRLDEAAVIWDNVRRLRHDLKNHFTVLVGKLENGDTDSCKKYLSELNRTVDSMGDLIRSGNAVIDYLINAKLSNLDNVQVLVSGYVGNYSDIEEIDLACILGNILDNAIEAQQSVKDEKRIELHFLYKNAARIIVCKNTVGDPVLKNNKDLLSTKDSSELHGLGHRIVESTVKKYGGIVDYYEDGEMFGVQILLPIKA